MHGRIHVIPDTHIHKSFIYLSSYIHQKNSCILSHTYAMHKGGFHSSFIHQQASFHI
eukprot:c4398_g1_i1 orf=34-204(-)